jgi:hypothetical protein
MPQRPATISQADLARLIRAGRKEGARAVKVTLRTGEIAEFTLGDSGDGDDKRPVKLAKRSRSII